ncbi:amidohydrolase family protein [Algoriphagus sp. CAU 1675]|uniref:amidohydrolase family protein n=1 Tax=Algoriphagus sp. CAU 1675 TaxID=3032597 RepID=UPI0023DCA9C6|nr:amidohydrolase family protein [Algoriphagus sp. CAU 1675]MDF2157806.1 amidohydrolase family protein [Algoriphagus sp. CAU 1675]
MKKTFLKASVLGLLITGLISVQSLFAQSDPTGKKPVTSTYAITNATVFTVPGSPGTKATVLIKDGVITGVGSKISLPKEAKIISADSLYIYPGFIDGASQAGITKPEDPKRPENFVSSNPPDEIAGITPWRSADDQYSGSSSQVNDFRKAGFTIAQIVPEGGMIAGKASIVVLGDEKSTNILKNNTALAANFRGARGMYPATAVGVMAKFRDVYKNTELTQQRSVQFTSNTGVVRPELTPTYSAMADVVNGQVPVLFTAENDLEVRRAISLQKELGFKLILTGLEEYDAVLDLIKSSGAKVLIQLAIPNDKAIKAQKEDVDEATKAQYARVKEAYDQALAQAGKLEKAGIPFAFTTVGEKAGEILPALRKMVEAGLSENAALAALTSNPASILGISKIAGTIESGKIANMVLTTGPLFSEDAQIKHVIVDGLIYDYEIKEKKKGNGNGNGEVKAEGTWEYVSETPAGSSGGTITINKSGSSYNGTITYDNPGGSGSASSPLKDISLSGNNLSFSFDVAAGGMSLNVKVSGEIANGTLEGSMSIAEYGSFTLTATQSPTFTANK